MHPFRPLFRVRSRLRATGRYRRADVAGFRSVLEIDDRITAPSFGFGNAAHYYSTQSASLFLSAIRVSSLLIYAEDDTLVPFSSVRFHTMPPNPWLEWVTSAHGGHLGFIGRQPHRFWIDDVIMDWIGRLPRPAA